MELADLPHEIYLELLDIHQALPLMHQEMVDFFVQLADLALITSPTLKWFRHTWHSMPSA